jgi:tetratricopeptide (TPR) repeat protein
MRHTSSTLTAAVSLLALLLAGCRWPHWQGPVSQSLVDCRRLSQQGVASLEQGQQQTAETLLAKAVAAYPTDAEARHHYAEALWRRGARPEAIAQMEQAQHLAPEDASLVARLAEMYADSGQLERAQGSAERAIRLDPKLPTAWAARGAAMRAGGQLQQALADELRALGYAPNDRAILTEVAELYRQLNQPERALQTLQNLAETYSPGEEPADVLYLLGVSYVALGRYDDGVESLSAAVVRGDPTPEMYCRLGEAELLAGHPAAAAAAARQALALQPQHRPSSELLQRVEMAQRNETLIR